MNILMVSLGTPGFVYPFMGHALKLEKKGHTVHFVKDSQFRCIVSKHGIENVLGGQDCAAGLIEELANTQKAVLRA